MSRPIKADRSRFETGAAQTGIGSGGARLAHPGPSVSPRLNPPQNLSNWLARDAFSKLQLPANSPRRKPTLPKVRFGEGEVS